ncbi:YigZ family protein [uncultured Desulfuromusa sp.]|uniref:YigZ family protein n=1 Tax=uncultured Desulfuromusa sp. TaxID=219183 RepID=UPI002AA62C57|nr:YigZ family protein [uncultured Desulfuromusa sp.]
MTPKNRYPIPAERFRCEIEVKHSRFITTIAATDTPEAALSFISAIKQEFPDATHNCWAYLIGPPGSTDRIGLSDDGEPHGVAGKPMLTTIQHSGLGDITAVVTRYFGGTKLGKGGMVKAYTLAVKTALEQLKVTEKIDWVELSLHFDYQYLGHIERLLPNFEVVLKEKQFAEKINLLLMLPEENYSDLYTQLTDLTSGQIELIKKE